MSFISPCSHHLLVPAFIFHAFASPCTHLRGLPRYKNDHWFLFVRLHWIYNYKCQTKVFWMVFWHFCTPIREQAQKDPIWIWWTEKIFVREFQFTQFCWYTTKAAQEWNNIRRKEIRLVISVMQMCRIISPWCNAAYSKPYITSCFKQVKHLQNVSIRNSKSQEPKYT